MARRTHDAKDRGYASAVRAQSKQRTLLLSSAWSWASGESVLITGKGFLPALVFTSRMVSARYLPLRSGQVTQYLSVRTGTLSGSRVISSCVGCSLGLDFFRTAHIAGISIK